MSESKFKVLDWVRVLAPPGGVYDAWTDSVGQVLRLKGSDLYLQTTEGNLVWVAESRCVKEDNPGEALDW